jgi:hypothetical protein
MNVSFLLPKSRESQRLHNAENLELIQTSIPYAPQGILNNNKNGSVIRMFCNDGTESTLHGRTDFNSSNTHK